MSTNAHARERLDFLDIHRGFAVLLMLWMHSADGWLQPALKHGATWDFIRGLGGLAAPTFLLLAGVSIGFGWAGEARPLRNVEIARGLGLVVAGYALRVQMWMLDAGGYQLVAGWAAALVLGLGYAAAYRALWTWGRGLGGSVKLGAAACALICAGLAIVATWVPERFLPLLRVDILQAIGASLVMLALLGEPLRRWRMLGLALGAAIALLTPAVRTWMPGPLPPPVAGYLAQWTPAPGEPNLTLFPLFPWMAYAFVGAVLGQRLGAAQRDGASARRVWVLGSLLGLVVALVCCEPLPVAKALLGAHPWLEQLVRLGYRTGASMVLGGLAVAWSQARAPFSRSLATLGSASLFVYWVHLELAFGTLAKSFVRTFDFRMWGLGLAALVVLMTVLAKGWLYARKLVATDAHRVQRVAHAGPSSPVPQHTNT